MWGSGDDDNDGRDSPCHKCNSYLPWQVLTRERRIRIEYIFWSLLFFFEPPDEMIAWQSILGSEGGGASDLTLGGVEHESLIQTTETVDFGFSCLQPHLELLLDGLEVPDMAGS